jgi:hypothetical protein
MCGIIVIARGWAVDQFAHESTSEHSDLDALCWPYDCRIALLQATEWPYQACISAVIHVIPNPLERSAAISISLRRKIAA